MFEELIARLRNMAGQENFRNVFDDSADAIEYLLALLKEQGIKL